MQGICKKTRWCIPVSVSLDVQLEGFVGRDGFITKSEFVRTAVRDRLEDELRKLEHKKQICAAGENGGQK